MNDKRQLRDDVKRCCITRTGCKALMQVTYQVKVRFNKCKDVVTLLSKAGMKPFEITKIVNAFRGGEKDQLTRVQCSTIVSEERKCNLGKECHGIIMHFKEKAMLDKDFYFAMNINEDGHLQPFRSRYDAFEDTYNQWVKRQYVEEFVSGWEKLKEKYHIEDDSWLGNMFKLRHHWVKAYLKDTFFAGMTTSGRSESIHSFFDGFVNAKTMLNDFVVQYDKAVSSRRSAEKDQDFRTLNSKPTLYSNHPIEEMATTCYT
ncbi:FAR1-related sequence 5-like protein [Tanacetum coccineum]